MSGTSIAASEVIRSARRLRRSPVASAVAVVSLAVAIAAVGLAGRVLWQLAAPVTAYRDEPRLVQLYATNPATCPECLDAFSRAEFERWTRSGLNSLERVALIREASLSPADRRQRPVRAAYVDEGFFDVIGGAALAGRLLAEEDHAGAALHAVASEPYWRNRLGGDSDAIGSSVELDGRRITIVGVLPGSFRIPNGVDLWLPRSADAASADPGLSGYLAIGRLRAGEIASQARAELSVLARRSAPADDPAAAARGATLRAYEDWPERADQSSTIAVVGLAVFGLVLLCLLNVSHVVQLGVLARAKEFAIRRALGASDRRLAGEIVAEVLVLSLVAAGASVAVYVAASRAAIEYFAITFRFDAMMLSLPAFATIALLLAVLVTAVLATPAILHVLARAGHDDLRGSATSSRPQQRRRGTMVFLQLSAVFVVATGATLLLRSYHETRRTESGLDDDGSVVAELKVDAAAGADARRAVLLAREAVEAASGGRAAAVWSSGKTDHFDPKRPVLYASGRGPVYSAPDLPAWLRPYPALSLAVSPRAFDVLGISVLAGRAFSEADRLGTAPVAIVNDAAARLLWPEGNVIGQQLRLGDERSQEPWLTIVGVVENSVHLFSLGISLKLVSQGRDPALLFRPYDQAGGERSSYLAIALAHANAAEVRAVDEEVARALPAGIRLAEELTPLRIWMAADEMVTRVRLTTQLLTSLALAALLVSLIGVYGLADEMVRSREREIALRRALGATGRSVATFFVTRLARLLAAATLAGAAAAALIAVLAERLLYGYNGIESEVRTGLAFGVTGHDPRLYLVAAACCAGMLAVGALRPVLRALRIEPAELLKGVD